MADQHSDATLRIRIDTDRLVLARQSAHIFERLAISFEALARIRTGRAYAATLRLERIHTGSLVADLLAVAGAVVTVYEFRDILIELIQNLRQSLEILMGQRGGEVSSGDEKTISALAEPVAKDGARQVSVQVVGDNANVLIIDASAVLELRMREVEKPVPLRAQSARPRIHSRGWPQYSREIPQEYRLHGEPTKVGFEGYDDNAPTDGTLIDVMGNWYVRFQGGDGALIPVRSSNFALNVLDRARTYNVRGTLLTSGNQVIGFTVQKVLDR